MKRVLLIVAGLGLCTIASGCMTASANQHRDRDHAPAISPPAANPPLFVARGDQVYELLVPPRGGTHTVIPPGAIVVRGHIYIPKAIIPQQGPPATEFVPPAGSNPLPMPSKAPATKSSVNVPPTSLGRDALPKTGSDLEDDVIPRAEITGVRAMTPEEVAAWEKEKAAKKKK